jgi:gliding motility-associated-like protein
MKNIFFLFVALIINSTSYALPAFKAKPFERKAFIENKGQLNHKLAKQYQGFKYCIDNSSQVLFNNNGLTYVVKKHNAKKQGAFAFLMSEEKREALMEESKRNNQLEEQYINITWLNSNPNATIEVSELQTTNYAYVMRPNNDKPYTQDCKGYSKLTYKNLYNGIDVEYLFTEKQGFKYNIIVAAGADVNQIKMQYSADAKPYMKNGTIVLKTINGTFTELAPYTFATQNKSNILASNFMLNDNTVSFAVNNPSKQAITIDPFVIIPPSTNPAYDNGVDNAGDIYLYGGAQGNYIVEKYNLSGGLIWSLGVNFPYAYYGDMLVEPSGNFYISEGFNGPLGAVTEKYSSTQALIWQSNRVSIYNEHWRLALNCITNKVIVSGGGTTTPTNNIAEIDVTTGLLNNVKPFYTIAYQDMSGLCVDDNGKSFVHNASQNQLIFTDNLNNGLATVSSGYNQAEVGLNGISLYPDDGLGTGTRVSNGYNMMALGGANFLFTSDGATLKKWDKNTYTLLASVAIPGGQQNMSGGILADKCNNLFVGSNLGVFRYDFNLTQKEYQASPAAVYDIAYSPTAEIIACGAGFAQSYVFGRESCGLLKAVIVSDPCITSVNTVKIQPLFGIPPYTFTWNDGSTDSIRTNLAPGKYLITVKDGNCISQIISDTVKIEFKPIKTLIAIKTPPCFGQSNGSLKINLTRGQTIASYTTSPSVASTIINDSTVLVTGLPLGNYTVHFVSNLGCIVDSVINLTQLTPLLSTASPTRVAHCPGQTTGAGKIVSLSGSLPNASGAPYSYSWNSVPVQTTDVLTGVTEGKYIVTITDAMGCIKKDSVIITANPLPKVVFVTDTVCLGFTTHFINNSTITLGSIASWNWSFGGTSTVPLPSSNVQNPTFDFTVCNNINNDALLIATSDSGCVDSLRSKVAINCLPVAPIITSLKNDSVCIGLTDSLKTTPVAGVTTYVYSTATGGNPLGTLDYQTAPIVANITYYFETKLLTSGCLSSTKRDSVTIKVLPRPTHPFLTTLPNDTICLNDSTTLKATTVAGNTIKWYSTADTLVAIGNNTAVVAPKASQYYYAEVKNKYGCKADEIRDKVFITVLPLPQTPKLIGNVAQICEDDSIVLYASVMPSTATIYWLTGKNWKDSIAKGKVFTSPILTSSTTFYLASISEYGCRSSDAFFAIPVTVKPLPHVTLTSNIVNNEIYEGQPIKFEANPSTYDIYKWYIENKKVYEGGYSYETQELINKESVKVRVSLNGCENWADNDIKIKVKPLSNAFTPNGDGKNDLFLKGLDLTIFNRWGQVLYTGFDGWDGSYKGLLASPGTYYYLVKIIKPKTGETIEKNGSLTLIID